MAPPSEPRKQVLVPTPRESEVLRLLRAGPARFSIVVPDSGVVEWVEKVQRIRIIDLLVDK